MNLACTYCRGEAQREAFAFCGTCLAPHHPECFATHGRCSVHGCGGKGLVRPRRAESAPVREPIASTRVSRTRRLERLQLHTIYALAVLLSFLASIWIAHEVGRAESEARIEHVSWVNDVANSEIHVLREQLESAHAKLVELHAADFGHWKQSRSVKVDRLVLKGTLYTSEGWFAVFGDSAVPLHGSVTYGDTTWQVRYIQDGEVELQSPVSVLKLDVVTSEPSRQG